MSQQNSAFDYVVEPAREEQEGLFPLGEVSLIAGASGSGKTTCIFQLLMSNQRGEDFFGREMHPYPYLYIMRDTSENGFKRTCKRMGIDPDSIRHYRTTAQEEIHSAAQLIETMLTSEQYKDVKVFWIEGLDMWVPEGKAGDFDTVARFISGLQRVAEKHHVAIIGSVGSPKMKPREKYSLHRDCIFGSVAWSRKTETIIFIQLVDPNDPNSVRELWILPRNGVNERFVFKFKNGIMVNVDADEDSTNWGRVILTWIETHCSPGDGFKVEQVIQGAVNAAGRRCSEATAYRELAKLVKNGFLIKKKKGIYQRAVYQSEPENFSSSTALSTTAEACL